MKLPWMGGLALESSLQAVWLVRRPARWHAADRGLLASSARNLPVGWQTGNRHPRPSALVRVPSSARPAWVKTNRKAGHNSAARRPDHLPAATSGRGKHAPTRPPGSPRSVPGSRRTSGFDHRRASGSGSECACCHRCAATADRGARSRCFRAGCPCARRCRGRPCVSPARAHRRGGLCRRPAVACGLR